MASCSKKALTFLALPLLLVLLAAPTSAARLASGSQEQCSSVKSCDEKSCGGSCAVLSINGVGTCKTVAGAPSCCCVPKSSAATITISSSFPLAAATGSQQKCGRVNLCDEKSCGAQCAFHDFAGVGTCKTIAGALNCCCVQKS